MNSPESMFTLPKLQFNDFKLSAIHTFFTADIGKVFGMYFHHTIRQDHAEIPYVIYFDKIKDYKTPEALREAIQTDLNRFFECKKKKITVSAVSRVAQIFAAVTSGRVHMLRVLMAKKAEELNQLDGITAQEILDKGLEQLDNIMVWLKELNILDADFESKLKYMASEELVNQVASFYE